MNRYHDAEVLKFVYDRHYANISRMGLRKSNYIALPGRAHQRYADYMKMIASSASNKAYFLDTDIDNCNAAHEFRNREMSNQPHLRRLKIEFMNVFNYDNGGIKTARVEDIGIGQHDSNSLMPKLLERLRRQSTYTKKDLWKAQIIDMSKRGKGGADIVVFKWMRYYFKILGAELAAVDGLNYEDRIKRGKIFSRGEVIFSYSDHSGKIGKVYDHFLKFDNAGRIGFVKVYTYTNGGPMISILVMYK